MLVDSSLLVPSDAFVRSGYPRLHSDNAEVKSQPQDQTVKILNLGPSSFSPSAASSSESQQHDQEMAVDKETAVDKEIAMDNDPDVIPHELFSVTPTLNGGSSAASRSGDDPTPIVRSRAASRSGDDPTPNDASSAVSRSGDDYMAEKATGTLPSEPAKSEGPPRKAKGIVWALIVFAILSSCFLFALDNTIVADVQPAIVERFDDIEKLPWLSAAFFLGALSTNLFW